jgi:hypothetical protein
VRGAHAAVRCADGRERFDHLVLATPARQALRLLADASADETAALAGFPTAPVQVLTHTDASLMPARRRDWSPVNLGSRRATAGRVDHLGECGAAGAPARPTF